MPPINDGVRSVSDAADKADLFNHSFASKFKCATDVSYPKFPSRSNTSLFDVHLDEHCILSALSELDPSKSVGPDGIQNVILRECRLGLCKPLLLLFKRSILCSALPLEWKHAIVSTRAV